MSDFTYSPSYGSDVSKKPRVLEAKFNEGYAQRAADGINANPAMWQLKFNVSAAVATTIMDFLDTKGGHTAFTWTPPGGSQAYFVCKTYSRTYDAFDGHTVTATFEQDYAP